MRKAAISAAIGLLAGALLMGVYFGASRLGIHIPPTAIVVVAAALAFSASVAVFAQAAMNRPLPKTKGSEVLTRQIRELDPTYVTAFPGDGGNTLRIVLRPDTKTEQLDIVKSPSSYNNEKKILVVIRKSSDKTQVFNPILLKSLFSALKERGNFLHILLVNDHDEYLGYIPAFYARSNFTGDTGESLIRRFIVDVLSGKEPSDILRTIGGLGSRDWISNEEKVAKAMEKMADGLLRGLVVLQGGRHRKPISVIYADDLIRATTPAAGWSLKI